MAIDKRGRIFVADRNNNRVQCFDRQGRHLLSFNAKTLAKGALSSPSDVWYDERYQRLLVADSNNHKVQIFSQEGRCLHDFECKENPQGRAFPPNGICTNHEGNIFLSDPSSHQILVFSRKGRFLFKFGSEGEGPGRLKYPAGVAILSNNQVVVSDRDNKRICLFGEDGIFVGSIGETSLFRPLWIHVDSEDNILVADNHFEGTPALKIFSREGKEIYNISHNAFASLYGVVANRDGQIFASGKKRDQEFCIFVLGR